MCCSCSCRQSRGFTDDEAVAWSSWVRQDHPRPPELVDTGSVGSEIGDFLSARRGRISPEQCGLPRGGRRRVPGLRREEVALLAGVSPDYYVRLEQGRAVSASEQVLDAVARVLRLDEVETEHLRHLVRPGRRNDARRKDPVRAGLLALLEAMVDVPAFVLGPRMDIVATNRLGDAVLPPADSTERRNAAAHVFLDPDAPTYYPDWAEVARDTAAHLRRMAGLRPADRLLRELIGELVVGSGDFVDIWARQEVAAKTHGTKLLRHPDAGLLEFTYETLALAGEPDHVLVTYTPMSEPTRDSLAVLGSLHAGEPALGATSRARPAGEAAGSRRR